MFESTPSSRWCSVVLILLLLELVLSAPQGYNYYSQRVQAQSLQAQRNQAQRRYQQANGYGGTGGFPDGYGGYGVYRGFGGRPYRGAFQNFLGLFLPGGAFKPNVPTGSGSLQNHLSIDPSLDGTGTGGSTGSVGSTSNSLLNALPEIITPGQLIGGVASTVNGIIQQLGGIPGING